MHLSSSASKFRIKRVCNFPESMNLRETAISLLFNGSEGFPSLSDRAKLLAKKFCKNSNLDGSGISLPAYPILNFIIFLLFPSC